MHKREYMKKLAPHVYWRFGRQEAVDILGDYEELLSDGELPTTMGSPKQAAGHLGMSQSYKSWLLAFWPMLLCLLVLGVQLYAGEKKPLFAALLAGLGALTALFWFWWEERGGQRKAPLPKGLLPLLLAMLLLAGVQGAVLCWALDTATLESAILAKGLLRAIPTLCAVGGLLGLFLAKLHDRRWRAAYVFALTLVLVSIFLLAIFESMSLDTSLSSWWLPYLWQGVGLLFGGLVATGVALC